MIASFAYTKEIKNVCKAYNNFAKSFEVPNCRKHNQNNPEHVLRHPDFRK